MTTTRRQFIDNIALGSLALGAMPLALGATPPEAAPTTGAQAGGYDDTWTRKVTGKVKAIFDVPEIEDGWGVYRAAAWAGTRERTLAAPAGDHSSVLVLRHHGIHLAMTQAFWDKYGTGKANKIGHPMTGQPSDKNPALFGVADLGERFGHNNLAEFQARGGIVLGCALAFEFYIAGMVAGADKISAEEAMTKSKTFLVPGVILQPTGVYAVLRAQEMGCMYIRAS